MDHHRNFGPHFAARQLFLSPRLEQFPSLISSGPDLGKKIGVAVLMEDQLRFNLLAPWLENRRRQHHDWRGAVEAPNRLDTAIAKQFGADPVFPGWKNLTSRNKLKRNF